MDEKQRLLKEFEDAIEELITVLFLFDDEKLNTIPFTGSWTAGQVGRHLLKSYSGLPQVLNGPSMATTRDPRMHVAPLRESLLDLNAKFQAPEFVLPEQRVYEQGELITGIRAVAEKITSSMQRLDANETCLGFRLPVLGELTRLEWLTFLTVHTQRHIQQLKDILAKLQP